MTPDFQKYVRPNEELAKLSGRAVSADTRVNPDGTLDISKWGRPQHDGPPLRALSVLKWMRSLRGSSRVSARAAARRLSEAFERTLVDAARLLQSDLAFTAAHWREPSFDIWEEELGHHYYTLRVSAAALSGGAEWLRSEGRAHDAEVLQARSRRRFCECSKVSGSPTRATTVRESCQRARIRPRSSTSP